MKKIFIFFATSLLLIGCNAGISEGSFFDEQAQEQNEKVKETPSTQIAQKLDRLDTLRVERMELNSYVIRMGIHFGYENPGESYPVHNILLSNNETLMDIDVRGYFIKEKDFLVFKNGKLFRNIGSEK